MTEFFEKIAHLADSSVENKSESDSDDGCDYNHIDPLCMICITNNKSTLLEPCNHLKFCEQCVDELMTPSTNNGVPVTPTCPQCNRQITGRRLVYF